MKTQMYDVPREVWLMVADARNHYGPSIRTIVGESRDDWFVIPRQRCSDALAEKYPKKRWRIVSKEEAAELEWSFQNHGNIAQQVTIQDPAILRQIAALIGCREGA